MSSELDQHLKAYEGNNVYDFDNDILLNWYSRRIIEVCSSDLSLLELGVGHGFTTLNFSKHFKRHVVLDGSASVIEFFEKNNPECSAEIVETFFEEFETDERFDVIVAGFILEHVNDPVQILNYYKKFLKPDGRMYISVPNAESMNRRLGNLVGLLDDMTAMSDNDKLLGHQRYYTLETLKEDVVKAGWTPVVTEGIYLKPLTTTQMVSLNLSSDLIDALCKLGIDYPELCCGILMELKQDN